MKLRRTWLNQSKGDMWEQKALALTIWIKHILHNSRLEKYSLGRLSAISGVSYRALKTYVSIMHINGYIHFEGTEKNRVLVIGKIASKRSCKNIDISNFKFDSFKEIYRSLRLLIMARLQAKKDYIKHLLLFRHDPKKGTDYKVIWRKVRNLVKCGVLKSTNDVYKEWGLSLRRIAEEIGCCVRTAERVVKFGENRNWFTKKHHFEQIYAPKTGFYVPDGYTFATKNNIYRVHPNTYTLSPSLSSALVLPV